MANNKLAQHTPQLPDKLTRRRRFFRSFEARALSNRSFAEKAADSITTATGSIFFLILNCYWFFVWIILNVNVIPGVHAFDPFPFGLLTMIVSLEAIILSIFVLISQNREAKVNSLREELDLQINLISEEEITKSLEMLAEIHKKLGITKGEDKELDRMLNRIDTSYIERSLQKQMDTGSPNLIQMMHGNGMRPKEKEVEIKPDTKEIVEKAKIP